MVYSCPERIITLQYIGRIPLTADLWNRALILIKKNIASNQFDNYIKILSFDSFENNTVTLVTANQFHQKYIKTYFLTDIVSALSTAAGEPVKIKLSVLKKTTPPRPAQQLIFPGIAESKRRPERPVLQPKYTFNKFIAGKCNELAYRSAQAVALRPTKEFNPLYIYGGTGLGKTHLAHATAHKIIAKHPNLKIVYVQAEVFKNEVSVAAIKKDRSKLWGKYRTCDVLIFDDVHHLANWHGTQKEFFDMFNQLYDSHRQIIVTSNVSPNNIYGIDDRIRSRLCVGGFFEVLPPERDVRIKIIQLKASQYSIKIPDDCIDAIADAFKQDIRTIEGCVVTLGAHASLMQKEITRSLTDRIINQIKNTDSSDTIISVKDIQKQVSSYFKLSGVEALTKRSKSRKFLYPRQLAMYLSRSLTDLSLKEIGSAFGGRDHTSVHNAIDSVKKKMLFDTSFKKKVDDLFTLCN